MSVWSHAVRVAAVFAAIWGLTTSHHHCLHDIQADKLAQSLTDDDADADAPRSRVAPQVMESFESVHELWHTSFLEAVGIRHLRATAEQSRAATAAVKSFLPIRIVFDLTKLQSDPGYSCTKEGDIVTVDGQSYQCSSNDVLTTDKKEFLVSVLLPAVQSYFASVLSVQRIVGNLQIPGLSCSLNAPWACCRSAVPLDIRTNGVADADYVLHVTARPTTGSTIAWALPCNVDQFGRPISGQANFGPARIDPSTPSARSEQIGTALHEMTHALVFSSGLFSDFRQPLNGAQWGLANVVSQTQGVGGIYVSKIITPSVVRHAQLHFNCFTWPNAGLELENGAQGSAAFSSHWEKRVVQNEYMSATSSYDPVYSALTLALFEDSGWYQVSYAKAQLLPWGYMEGCGMAQARCKEWSTRYICSANTQTACTADYNSKGYCDIVNYQDSIPAGFQYFNTPTLGGRDTYADFCPFYRGYSNGDCRGIGRVSTLADTNNWMEVVGPSSKCFASSLSRSSSDTAAMRSTCYSVLGCTSEGLRVQVGTKEVLCPMEGGKITVDGYRGALLCPVANRLCQMLQDQCSGHGVLLATGACQCYAGYVGADCSGLSCPKSSDGLECSGTSHGACNSTSGVCSCLDAYTGLTCADLACPTATDPTNLKAVGECSGHGSCQGSSGVCTCSDGYSGKACECVPGCTASSCGAHGTCDCETGACICQQGYSGVTCAAVKTATAVTLSEQSTTPVKGTLASKTYTFFKIYLSSSAYDITLSVTYDNASGVDMDLYGSFVDEWPTPLSAKANLFVSNYGLGSQDAITLCGSLGVFPRGLRDSLHYCAQPTSAYVQESPGFFYLSILAYEGGAYTLSIETDKCRDVDCSEHGRCGVQFAGVCTCDRYWTGVDCSVPQCGPDCLDLGTCTTSTMTSSLTEADLAYLTATTSTATAGLRNTSECYGNGVCQVPTTNASTSMLTSTTPRCVCDEAFTYANPTPTQALCKELAPSIASIQHFTAPFAVRAEVAERQVAVGSWHLFTLQVQDAWTVLVANLESLTTDGDAMLLVRREKLPSLTPSTSATDAAYVQFMDTDGWTDSSKTRKIVLTRATSTLSTGLYYIGVANSAYARASLGYSLTVDATADCSTTSIGALCQNGGVCRANSSQLCACASSFVGKYCEQQVERRVLTVPTNTSAFNASTKSYIAYESISTQTLGIAQWAYFSFDVTDPAAKYVQFQLVIEDPPKDSDSTPVLPVLLARGPTQDGFPTLNSDSQQDYEGVSQRRAEQHVTLPVEQACAFATSQRDCYKIALFNRVYSGRWLYYRLRVVVFPSAGGIFASATSCGINGGAVNCHSHGKCLLLASTSTSTASNATNATTTTTTTIATPTCQCYSGWTGVQCNSPRAFDMPQLWAAMSNASLICSTCASEPFTLARSEVRLFRVPQVLRMDDGYGLRLRVVRTTSTSSSTSSSSSGTIPNIYVSDVLPRSIYDFTHISSSNGSTTTTSTAATAADQVVNLTNSSVSGHFWVVVFSEYPAAATPTQLSRSSQVSRQRRLLDSPPTASYRLEAAMYQLEGATSDAASKTLLQRIVAWMFDTPIGLAVFIAVVAILVLVVGYCIWRLCHAPAHQDRAIRRFFGGRNGAPVSDRTAKNQANAGGATSPAHVVAIEMAGASRR